MPTASHAVKVRKRLRYALCLALGAVALVLPACEWDGHFTILGYSTQPNYDANIHSVYVPIFKNNTLYRELGPELTQTLVRYIEAQTPFKVVSNRECADTELTGRIINFQKVLLNYNQLNEVREAQTIMTVEVIWRDLRTGEPLSQPRPRGIESYPQIPLAQIPSGPGAIKPPPVVGVPVAPLPEGAPAPPDPSHPEQGALILPEPPTPPAAAPVLIQSTATFIPELGGSLTTAQKDNVDKAALQIIHMMEKPW